MPRPDPAFPAGAGSDVSSFLQPVKLMANARIKSAFFIVFELSKFNTPILFV